MRRSWVVVAALAALTAAPAAAGAQAAPPADSLRLTLDEALARALSGSQEVRLARADVRLAEQQVRAARGQALPQLNGNLTYTRTFDSPFSSGGGSAVPDSLLFSPDTTAPLEERVRYLEDNVETAGLGSLGSLFGDLPFGRENQYIASLSASQLLYSGGRTGAALRIARSYRQAAELGLQEETSEVALQVRTAYYRALLAGELESIATAALAQAEAFLAQERLRLDAGTASELDVLRAEVSRDNLRPQLVEARNAAELALLDLKRLLDVPVETPLALATPLVAAEAALAATPAPLTADADPTEGRASLAQAEAQVDIRSQGVRVARGAFLPSVSVQANYGRQLFPESPFDVTGNPWATDFTAAVTVSVPIFNGFQRNAELQQARVELDRARLQLEQLREGVRLEYEQARGERERARTTIAARQATVGVAQRVYDLTLLRYQQGLATQLEVSQSRLELLQARSNLAQATADFLIADARLARAVGGGVPSTAALPTTTDDRPGAEGR